VRFFLDNCLSPTLALVLRQLEEATDRHTVMHLRDTFAQDAPDVVWIERLAAERDRIVISGDPRITKNKAEKAAWREAGLTGFFLKEGWTALTLMDQAWRLVKIWPKIVAAAQRARPGSAWYVPIRGETFQRIDLD